MKKAKNNKGLAKQIRGSWLGVNPVTRVVESKKLYNRKRMPKVEY